LIAVVARALTAPNAGSRHDRGRPGRHGPLYLGGSDENPYEYPQIEVARHGVGIPATASR
jgi:hypothetical protein